MYTVLPPTGMRDFAPKEKAIRERVMQEIKAEYARAGFTEIETSQIENLDNLTGGDGGENTKLIFKILKRGQKFSSALEELTPESSLETAENSVCDLGLRFDLTLPLVRFYANNRGELPTIFKAIQTGTVFRAERPQKGRYRAFTQCDVDIIGDATNLAEVETITTVARTLRRLSFDAFTIKINDRRILKALILASGFKEAAFEDVALTLDKLDKIGDQGVRNELLSKAYADAEVSKLMDTSSTMDLESVKTLCPEGYANIKEIIEAVSADPTLPSGASMVFAHTLVRGMGYYTGTIFEVTVDAFGASIAGGGRYDNMIEKLSGTGAPAVGFSIGYERIVDLLLERDLNPSGDKRVAFLFPETIGLAEALRESAPFREQVDVLSLYRLKKKLGKQLNQLEKAGFNGYIIHTGEGAPTLKWFEETRV